MFPKWNHGTYPDTLHGFFFFFYTKPEKWSLETVWKGQVIGWTICLSLSNLARQLDSQDHKIVRESSQDADWWKPPVVRTQAHNSKPDKTDLVTPWYHESSCLARSHGTHFGEHWSKLFIPDSFSVEPSLLLYIRSILMLLSTRSRTPWPSLRRSTLVGTILEKKKKIH